jgi:pimeloyl-ACP methyl ester carboxylesterase
MFKYSLQKSFVFGVLCVALFSLSIQAQIVNPVVPKGKLPVIIIPGLTGSELVNNKTGEVAWFKSKRSKDDDLRLPIFPNTAKNRDSLVARDIIRSLKFLKILPETEIYERLIDALEKRGGYTEGKWDNPTLKGYEDTFYVFAYDWRRDNVENARLLVKKIENLKRLLKRPDLKFNVIAHSNGGLLTRYAAMYGDTDLPVGKPKPTWVGARNFDKVFLLGTPNEGSLEALDTLLSGFSLIKGVNLPFVQDITRFDIFTLPSIYQVLPHQGTLTAYDENLKPLQIDIYDEKTWETYGWGIWQDDGFYKEFNATERANARPFFRAMLARAKRFQEALDANTSEKTLVSMYIIGSECKDTPNSMVIYRDAKKDRWKTIFKADSFERSDGGKVTSEELKKVIYSMGDGVVTKRSLAAETLTQAGNKTILPIVSEIFLCEGHARLITSLEVQDKLFALLIGDAAIKAVK